MNVPQQENEVTTLLKRAREFVREFRHDQLGTEHVLLALIKQPVHPLLEAICNMTGHTSVTYIEPFVLSQIQYGADDFITPESIENTPRLELALSRAKVAANESGRNTSDLGDVILALLDDTESFAGNILTDRCGPAWKVDDVRRCIETYRQQSTGS